jgi:iron uptake system EfeUOB component EfeO/EfeM
MKKAEQAKEEALRNKETMELQSKVRIDKEFSNSVASLVTHLHTLIEEAIKKGQLSTTKTEFPISRFSDEVIRKVADSLRDDGYTLAMSKHNAYNTISFTVHFS